MKRAGFFLFAAANYIITLLPLRVLYLFSDLFFIVIYYLVGYRRKIVSENLRNSFPEKTEAELMVIERKYYHHLCDLIVETLKLTHMGSKEIASRFRFNDLSLVDRLYESGRDVIAVCSHYNNWEWLSSMPLHSPYRTMTIYRPLKNEYFDRFLIRLRSKFGVGVSPMQHILRDLVKMRKENVRTLTAFIADQTPPPDEHTYWTTFLNQETGFFRGTEKVAVMLDMAVVFVHIRKIRRGYYEVDARLITEHAREEAQDMITSTHVRMLEEVIRQTPEYWLWSHRRWKHKRKTGL